MRMLIQGGPLDVYTKIRLGCSFQKLSIYTIPVERNVQSLGFFCFQLNSPLYAHRITLYKAHANSDKSTKLRHEEEDSRSEKNQIK